MPYVTRDEQNKVVSIFNRKQYDNQEYITSNHPDVVGVFLLERKEEKKRELTEEFNVRLNAGFTSDALGSTHTYDSHPHNRENISMSLNTGVDVLHTCDDGTTKTQRSHTNLQMVQVAADFVSHRDSLIATLRSLKDTVDQAVDEATVDAVVWP